MTENDSSHDTDLYGYETPMVGPLDAPERDSGLHPVNIGQLVMGVAFAGLVTVWALLQADVVDSSDLRWMMPVPWIVAGAAGLVATTWRRSGSGE